MRACWGWDAQSSPYSVPPSASERGSRISLLVLTSPRIAGGFCPCGPALSALVHRELPEAQIATPTPPRPASRSRERLAAEAGEAREFACCPTRLLRAPPHPDTRYAKKCARSSFTAPPTVAAKQQGWHHPASARADASKPISGIVGGEETVPQRARAAERKFSHSAALALEYCTKKPTLHKHRQHVLLAAIYSSRTDIKCKNFCFFFSFSKS